MISIEVRIAKNNPVSAMAEALTPRNRRTVHRQIGERLRGIVLRNFQYERNDGNKWAPLKPKTVKRKALDGYKKILQNTGQLRQSFDKVWDENKAGVGAKGFVGGKRPFELAAIHEFGVPQKGIPARPMLPSKALALETAIKVYNKYISVKRDEAKK